MNISKLNIENFKCFDGKFSLSFNSGINIIVGNNEAGKSTILEAIHLALTGIYNGRYLRNELSQYLFNIDATNRFLNNIKSDDKTPLPHVNIEVFLENGDESMIALLEGNGNSDRETASGIRLKIEFDESYKDEYEKLIEKETLDSIPIEYYKITWKSFARSTISSRSIPLKSALIDSSSNRYQNGSDVYISRIVKEHLDSKQKAEISQAYRKLKENFMEEDSIKEINKQIKEGSNISNKDVKIAVDLQTQNAWESSLMTYLDEIPFHQIGKGEQCIIKTNLALAHKKTEDANLVLLEEPESHLSHSKLNEFVKSISDKCCDKQVILSTHSSFVANKLGLKNLVFLNKNNQVKLSDLKSGTQDFFMKLPGYDTLRLVLSKKAVLVEGPSDELIFQKAYMIKNDGRLPIEDGIDVISVGLSFKRFLTIAEKMNKCVAVITDNDGDYNSKIINKYKDFKNMDNIKIFADENNVLNTLEPQFVEANNWEMLKKIVVSEKCQNSCKTKAELIDYMIKNKTTWALRIFESDEKVEFPEYIKNAVRWCGE